MRSCHRNSSTESADDPGRRASRVDNRRRPRAAPPSRGVPPIRGTSGGSRAPVYQILWVGAFRDATISGRGFNLIKPLRRHFRTTPFCLVPSRAAIPPKRVGSKDCRAACELRLKSHVESVKSLQGRKFPILPQRDPLFGATPARRRLAARGRARAVARGWSPRSERCRRRWSCVGSGTREVTGRSEDLA